VFAVTVNELVVLLETHKLPFPTPVAVIITREFEAYVNGKLTVTVPLLHAAAPHCMFTEPVARGRFAVPA
jgi:hypothetical protein